MRSCTTYIRKSISPYTNNTRFILVLQASFDHPPDLLIDLPEGSEQGAALDLIDGVRVGTEHLGQGRLADLSQLGCGWKETLDCSVS